MLKVAGGYLYPTTEHDAMAIDRPKSELTHSPRFVAEVLDDFGWRITNTSVVAVNIVNREIGEVSVIANVSRGQRVRTLARHDFAVAIREHSPSVGTKLRDGEAQHVTIEHGGAFEIRHGNHKQRSAIIARDSSVGVAVQRQRRSEGRGFIERKRQTTSVYKEGSASPLSLARGYLDQINAPTQTIECDPEPSSAPQIAPFINGTTVNRRHT